MGRLKKHVAETRKRLAEARSKQIAGAGKKHIAEARLQTSRQTTADTMHWESNGFDHLPPSDTRFDQFNHFPIRVVKTREQACQREGCDKDTVYRCLKCNNYLCIGTRKATNCFYLFHIESCKENLTNGQFVSHSTQVETKKSGKSSSTLKTMNLIKEVDVSKIKSQDSDSTPGSFKKNLTVKLVRLENSKALNKTDNNGSNALKVIDDQDPLETSTTPKFSERSRRQIKPKIDPNFKYLPAGGKRKSFPNESLPQRVEAPAPKPTKRKLSLSGSESVQETDDSPSLKSHGGPPPLKVKREKNQTPSIPKPIQIRKRKYKPKYQLTSAYMKLKKQKNLANKNAAKTMEQKIAKLLDIKPKLQNIKTIPDSLVKTPKAHPSPLVNVPVKVPVSQIQEPHQYYPGEIVYPDTPPETILPDDVPSTLPYNYKTYITTIQPVTVKQEPPVTICDTVPGEGYNVTTVNSGEEVLSFFQF